MRYAFKGANSMSTIPSSEITPEHIYISRRRLLKGAIFSAAAAALAACAPAAGGLSPIKNSATADTSATVTPGLKDELGSPATSYDAITTYNNYYEYAQDKSSPAVMAGNLIVSPWTVKVGGLVRNPMTIDIDDIRKKYTQEDRIYRLRCVDAWSMVIPWVGFSLAKLLKEVEPTSDAKYVRFESLLDPQQMPGQRDNYFPWPYVEGLRIDEAMNDLAILATGLYGKPLSRQNGAPIRLVVPWKYGFKSIKAVVKIDLVAEMPKSLWMAANSYEYGFFANVNPEVPHPRWSQSTERRIEENGRRETIKFNGYDSQVASLYTGLDLKKWY
jgi:sulfoxide reductase catalytic subunit YedY